MPRTDLNHYLAMLLFVCASPSLAGQAEESIARCADSGSQQARIQCLEEALRSRDVGNVGPPAHAGDVATNQASTDALAARDEPNSPPAATSGATPPEAANASSTAPPISADAAASDLSPAAVAADRPEQIAATVTSVRENAYGKLLFTTASGQVWIQTDQNRRRYRNVPFEAEIRGGASGSFFLRQATGGPSVRVRRQK